MRNSFRRRLYDAIAAEQRHYDVMGKDRPPLIVLYDTYYTGGIAIRRFFWHEVRWLRNYRRIHWNPREEKSPHIWVWRPEFTGVPFIAWLRKHDFDLQTVVAAVLIALLRWGSQCLRRLRGWRESLIDSRAQFMPSMLSSSEDNYLPMRTLRKLSLPKVSFQPRYPASLQSMASSSNAMMRSLGKHPVLDSWWSIAAILGLGGMFLLMFLFQWAAVQPKLVNAASIVAAEVPEEPEVTEPADQEEPVVDRFNGLPNPFLSAPEEIIEEPVPVASSELQWQLDRTSLPGYIAMFNPDIQNDQLLAEQYFSWDEADNSQIALAADDWDRSSMPRRLDSLVPAGYEQSAPATHELASIPRPSDHTVGTEAASKLMHVAVRKSQPAQAPANGFIDYELYIQNQGKTDADALVVREKILSPHRVAAVDPPAAFEEGTLQWHLGTLRAGDTETVRVSVYADDPSDFESETTVQPVALFAASTNVVEGNLRLRTTVPEWVAIGEAVPIEFEVLNTGDTTLSDITLESTLPPQLSHRNGRDLVLEIGTLAAGETHSAKLTVSAAQLGEAILFTEVASHEGLTKTVIADLEVVKQQQAKATDQQEREIAPAAEKPSVAASPCCPCCKSSPCQLGAISPPLISPPTIWLR
ncbi:COG1361 family protein [Calycomorphotria hydatis]|uniref:DUF11 domain-containing protein n=1 Tax=Calycomorphotria hydatis TaxID=2528027 RepID=UPI0011A219D0|nr:DUF11 domain-containing protein [Calycomorphotria hydatis]